VKRIEAAAGRLPIAPAQLCGADRAVCFSWLTSCMSLSRSLEHHFCLSAEAQSRPLRGAVNLRASGAIGFDSQTGFISQTGFNSQTGFISQTLK
jgi:hypothetical protein